MLVLLFMLSGSMFAEGHVISAAGNQLTIELPDGFVRPSAEVLAKVYPNGKPKEMFRYSAVDGTIQFDLASSNATASLLPLIKTKDEQDLARDPRPMRWIAHEVTTFQGKPCLRLEYTRAISDGDMHYQAYYVLNNSNLVFFQFSIPEKQASRFLESFRKSLASIKFAR